MARLDQIEKYLKEKELDYKLIDLLDMAISVEDVVRVSNGQVNKDEIIKTLIIKTKKGDFRGCVLRGENRLTREIIDRLATKEEVFQIAGVKPGAVCPILLGIPLILDKKVVSLTRVNMGSGDHLKGLEMNLPALLKALDDFRIEEISEEISNE